MALALLVAALIAGLLRIPFGLPGLWVMAGAVVVYSYAGAPNPIGTTTVFDRSRKASISAQVERCSSMRCLIGRGGRQ